MAVKMTPELIRKINELYYVNHNKAATAREIGCSPATVSRYIDPNFTPFDASNEVHFYIDDLPADFGTVQFRGIDNYGALCIMSTEEFKEVKDELAKEIH